MNILQYEVVIYLSCIIRFRNLLQRKLKDESLYTKLFHIIFILHLLLSLPSLQLILYYKLNTSNLTPHIQLLFFQPNINKINHPQNSPKKTTKTTITKSVEFMFAEELINQLRSTHQACDIPPSFSRSLLSYLLIFPTSTNKSHQQQQPFLFF